MNKPKLVVFTGAGMSAESGINTFRDDGGLWEQYDVMEVCSSHALIYNRPLVFQFFNDVRRAFINAEPNAGHHELAALEDVFDVTIITQNIDDLHERAGSTRVIHLHGEVRYKRNEHTGVLSLWTEDLAVDGKYRPHVVMFGEDPEYFDMAIDECNAADYGLIVGTSLQVYPAANLACEFNCNLRYLVDPNPPTNSGFINVPDVASVGCKKVADYLRAII